MEVDGDGLQHELREVKTWTQWLEVKEPNHTLSLPIDKYQYEQIQEDARLTGYVQGMTYAALLSAEGGCTNAGCGGEYHGKRCPLGIEDLILTARDAFLRENIK